MRLVTLDTWGIRGEWDRALPILRDGFSDLEADIVPLQETVLTDQLDGVPAGQVVTTASRCMLEALVAESPGHTVVAGDMNADPDADSIRFCSGRHVIDDVSGCHRNARQATPTGTEPLLTYLPQNPCQTDPDWPFRAIAHIFVRCVRNGPMLLTRGCRRVFDTEFTKASDHYGLAVDPQPVRARHSAEKGER